MSSRTPADAERWMRQGTELFDAGLSGLDDDALTGPTALQGWTGRHLVAHVAANADALSNLVHWAASGQETPMYVSMAQREADIEAGAHRTPAQLRRWFASSADRLTEGYGALDPDQLAFQVRTAQGRPVPAAEIAWLRAREVMVHAVDLGTLTSSAPGSPASSRPTFADLPDDFLVALVADIVTKRSAGGGPALLVAPTDGGLWTITGEGDPTRVSGSLPDVAAYLAGRASGLDGTAPPLPRWL